MKRCAKCGCQNDDRYLQCAICGEELSALGSHVASKVFRAKRSTILWRLLLAVLVLPIVGLALGMFGALAGIVFSGFITGVLAGLAYGIYRLLCRIEVSPDGVTAQTPFGSSEIRFTEVERWSVEHGDDHDKSVWKRNPLALQSNFTVNFRRMGETRVTRVHDWEVLDPGWNEFLETVRNHLGGKEA